MGMKVSRGLPSQILATQIPEPWKNTQNHFPKWGKMKVLRWNLLKDTQWFPVLGDKLINPIRVLNGSIYKDSDSYH